MPAEEPVVITTPEPVEVIEAPAPELPVIETAAPVAQLPSMGGPQTGDMSTMQIWLVIMLAAFGALVDWMIIVGYNKRHQFDF